MGKSEQSLSQIGTDGLSAAGTILTRMPVPLFEGCRYQMAVPATQTTTIPALKNILLCYPNVLLPTVPYDTVCRSFQES
jgi:hypothetical protein